jgi:hypothetical protein
MIVNSEYCAERMVFPLHSYRNPTNISMGSQVNCCRNRDDPYRLPCDYRIPLERVRCGSRQCFKRLDLCQRSYYVPLPGSLLGCLDASVYSISAGDCELLDTRSHCRSVAIYVEYVWVSLITSFYSSTSRNSYEY